MKNFTHDLRIWFKYTVSRFWWKCNFRLDERAADRLEQEIKLRSRTHNQLPMINLTARQIECSLPLRIPERACVILHSCSSLVYYTLRSYSSAPLLDLSFLCCFPFAEISDQTTWCATAIWSGWPGGWKWQGSYWMLPWSVPFHPS